jgi:lipoate-protein ligase A
MYYLQTGSTDPAFNLAFEEYVLKNRLQGDYLILWQNHNAVIVGRNQNTLEEIDRTFVEDHNIRVIRRNTGGGAVYHDLGNLNYSFISDAGDDNANRFTHPVVKALQALGLEASASGRNDILVSGRKVSGTARQRFGGRILHHGTLLFDSDPDKIAGALRPDPAKFQSKSVKSVRSRVGNIRSFLHTDMDMAHFWAYLTTALADHITPAALTAEELAQVQVLKSEKYDTWQWNFGSSPTFGTVIRRHYSGGSLELQLTVTHGQIRDMAIYGDFLAETPVKPLIDALVGCPYQKAAIADRLSAFSLSQHLGSITVEEFLSAIMNE